MPKTWITADWHLGERRLELMQRPFQDPQEMFNVLLANHNAVVAEEDLVILNGDVISKSAEDRHFWLGVIPQFKGQKTLLRGNHDEGLSDADFEPYFTRILPEGEGIEMESEGIPLYITHYPTLARTDRFNLVGHIHSAWKYQLNSLNVGVDVHHFRPAPLDKVGFYLNAIETFYDDDVWVAYHPANESYRGRRGKRGSYFPPKEGGSRGGE
jgi:calcineurin-like phosphoesterase family protein